MPSSFVLSLVLAVVVLVLIRLLLPGRTKPRRAGWVDAALVAIGDLGLTFHCGAMFYRSTVDRIPGSGVPVDAIDRMGTASILAFAVAAAILLIGLRRARPVLLILVVGGLTAVGVTMYDGGSLDAHLTSIVVAVALIALATTDLYATGTRGRRARTGSSPATSG